MKKINISRQNVYLLALSTFLLIFVILFAFLLLIPEGKEYRIKKSELKKVTREFSEYKKFHDETYNMLKELQSKNQHIIRAFKTSFTPKEFQEKHKGYFSSLHISEVLQGSNDGEFRVYEVNATSKIDSPKSFYDFLEALNKSDWIIGVDFPIHFKRVDHLIASSFTMKVYSSPPKVSKSKEKRLTSKQLFEE